MTKNYLVILAVLPLGGCNGLYGHDEMGRYIQRSNTITLTAGNAKEVNAVAHTITPWPHYVGDRRIATDARRAGAAVTRYSRTERPVDQLPAIGDATKPMGEPPPVTTNQNINSNITQKGP